MGLLYEKESYEIRGACFWIWKEFGSAFKEAIIERAFIEELVRRRGLSVERQKRIDIFYFGKKVGTYVPDIIVNDSILIELKSKPILIREDFLQFQRYLRGSNYKLGFLINFGNRLIIERFIYDEIREGSASAIRERSAFTLVEVTLVIAITAVLTAMSLGFTRSSEKRVILLREQAKVIGALERAKTLAIQRYKTEGASRACGFGVFFDKTSSPNAVVVFSDLEPCSGNRDEGEDIQKLAFDSRIEILSAPEKPVIFKAPYLETENPGDIILQIKGSDPAQKVGVAVTAGGGVAGK